ncbi:MAG: SusE domain-containing protein [Janthinobacterium lividum]
MKKILVNLLAFGAIALLSQSCKKDGAIATSNGGTAGTLSVSSSTLVLQRASLTDTTKVINFNFTKPNYGYSAAVTNTLQIDKLGDNWANPTSVTLGTNILTQGYSTADFDALLLKLGLTGSVATQVQARVMHSISSNVTPVYSNVVSITATPFYLTSWLYVVGDFQGYSTSSPDSLLSATSNGIYTGIINFPAGKNQFLILPAKNFNNKYATNNATGSTSTTVAYNASNNLFAPATPGQYIITLNLNTNTISFALANTYSVIGSTTAGGNFSTDVDLTKYVNDGNTGWMSTIAMTAGAFKIRQNHDWTFAWGDISPADGKDATDANGGNINVAAAGNYKVTFAIPISAIGATPSVTATYAVVKQ